LALNVPRVFELDNVFASGGGNGGGGGSNGANGSGGRDSGGGNGGNGGNGGGGGGDEVSALEGTFATSIYWTFGLKEMHWRVSIQPFSSLAACPDEPIHSRIYKEKLCIISFEILAV